MHFQMASTRKVIELFYDVVSPYNWFAFEVLCRYRSVWNMDLKLRPAFLSGILHGSGNTTPSLLPRKCSYMRKEMARLEPYFRVPILIPNDPIGSMVKKGSLSAMRFITAVDESRDGGQAEVENVSRELWKRIWGHDEDITLPASLSEAGLKAGLSPYEIEKLLRLASSKKIKDKLKSTTQEALDYGAFGLPFMICHVKGQKEAFFGSDRFEIMAQCIGEQWMGPQPDKMSAKM
ncbi:glutathione S-transferase kappa 1-like [Conger conger]|uniref:glutathione S-transferase kappa 1-like n=1 Tax=Conger conger TaxID=82655 RepID=UPI002A59A6D8|nr:glutathione S-transferase kappa 1-like [Conger conger]XP_061092106.1 glutathione S-transferase kappa 1-like [Conger conger]